MSLLKILICPEPFQGGLSAHKVSGVIADGLCATSTEFELQQVPMVIDQRVVQTIVEACGGEWRDTVALGDQGRTTRVQYGILHEGRTAVLMPERTSTRTIEEMSSFGAGQLIKAAIQDRLVERVYFYLPEGIWPVDGGMGLLQALGVSLLDPDGKSINWNPNNLANMARLTRVDFKGALPRLKQVEVIVACDVSTPLLGRQGAAWKWGSQTGANFTVIEKMDQALTYLAEINQKTNDSGHHLLSGAAAGGGIGYGLALLGAKLRPANHVFLENLDFAEQIRNVDLVITGQGQSDRQTLPQQLAPLVLQLCQQTGTPGIMLSGSIRTQELETVFASGAWAVFDATPGIMSTAQLLENAAEHVYFSAQQLGRLLLLGKRLGSKGL